MTPSADQNAALASLLSGKSLFLTGGAGTGKSWVLNEFIKRARGQGIVRLGSTGAAAKLIGGQTLHSWFRLDNRVHVPEAVVMTDYDQRRIRAAKTIIIDEISMTRIDQFQAIRDRLFAAARGYGAFAGYQLVVVGDFAQLPPVVTPGEAEALSRTYGEGRRFAFQNRHWDGLETAELTTIHRQSGDPAFARTLGAMRLGQPVDLSLINAQVGKPSSDAVRLVSTRRAAEEINRAKMSAMKGGHFRIEGKRENFPDNEMRVPLVLELKRNAKVIICANNHDAGYVNGSAGVLLGCSRDAQRRPQAHVRLESGREVTVTRHIWDSIHHDVNDQGHVVARVNGRFSQLPILPGWAITIHRSQGMTMESAHIDPRGSFEPGQIYVALSRCSTLEGIGLDAPVSEEQILTAPEVASFMSQVGEQQAQAA